MDREYSLYNSGRLKDYILKFVAEQKMEEVKASKEMTREFKVRLEGWTYFTIIHDPFDESLTFTKSSGSDGEYKIKIRYDGVVDFYTDLDAAINYAVAKSKFATHKNEVKFLSNLCDEIY
ncbi:hypothetical protein Ab1vBOLIVR5_gp80c [Agrobacterium phage OLIVR5]|uniref:Uncharacterized protein n=3 Tax=Caudoviricetes TaxID=2731619 RepID=A0A858MT03_9CAUD|nr:hypothetical protein KNU99_gp080 [Agrobacterium phage OLIVR5]QIW87728.1 hypothetical protein Ab1vBOLIVR5_gp80c [Agrobacterium phage OLIVR5]QIW87990.1 hypothetical protein Ab1vBOLIVR6_gp83c [Agrobacterium phage OLIVR6]